MLCIELIGKYQMNLYKEDRKYFMKGKKDKNVQAITNIDPATDWLEICSVPEATIDLVAKQVKLV